MIKILYKNKILIFVFGIVVLLYIFYTVINVFFSSSDYLLWVYTRDNTGRSHFVEVTSGYKSLLSCEQAGRVYSYSNDKQKSFFHCATGCSLDAESEQDCKQHD